MRRDIIILATLTLLATAVRADVDVTFTRPGGEPLGPLGRHELVQGVELWMTNRDAATTALAAFEFRFDGGSLSTTAVCATNWSLSSAFNGLSPSWINVDTSLGSCVANRAVSGVTGSLATPFDGPALPLDVPVLIGTFDFQVNALPEALTLDLSLGGGSGIDDQAGRFGGGGIGVSGATIGLHNGRTVDVALRVVADGVAGSDEGSLPAGVSEVVVGNDCFLEIWLSQVDGGSDGIGRASVDVAFDSALVAADPLIDHGAVFDDAPLSGIVDNGAGMLDDAGGATLLAGRGISPAWVRLVRVRITAMQTGLANFGLSPGALAFRLTGSSHDLLPTYEIHVESPSAVAIVEAPPPDCNLNSTADAQDIASGLSRDCNANLVPDECDLADGVSQDCNADDRPDECGAVDLCTLQRSTASDQEPDARFGNDVAIDGETALVGARLDNCISGASNCGSAYVLTYSGGCWEETAKLTAVDQAVNDLFGFAVAVNGDVAVVGARSADCSALIHDCGAAYVFRRNGGGQWSQEAKLMASDKAAGDQFGASVSFDGNRIVVGSVFDDCPNGSQECGSAYVFAHNGSQWFEQGRLAASDLAANDNFGHSVALDGNWAMAGAVLNNCDGGAEDCGAVYLFHFNNGSWGPAGKLRGADTSTGDNFGNRVSLAGDLAVIGAEMDGCANGGTKCGSAYVFRRSGQTWIQEQKLRASNERALNTFGNVVATNGEAILVGAPLADCEDDTVNCGVAYLFRRNGPQWTEVSRLSAFKNGDQGDQFGVSGGLGDGLGIVGAYTDDCNNGSIQCGSIYTFSFSGLDADCDGASEVCELSADFDGDSLNDGCDPDIDNDGVPDGLDPCDYTPSGHPIDAQGRSRGDLDHDCDVDLQDFHDFVGCLAPQGPTGPPSSPECNAAFDYAPDSRVNLADFAVFQHAFALNAP